ncbi:MAG: hypothetical protein AW09_001625 [Candidatus Accumulibacter phosphatis]|uniref:Uncharacterized protein n=1 Tax=Candidatus Accumulibacter phosphatis TaxID=327160 RepID=A0A080LWW9_9PROT|nr:MAG: hypothetical protein AW09_001625 [Candidatus Accumulibacter phosphatis]
MGNEAIQAVEGFSVDFDPDPGAGVGDDQIDVAFFGWPGIAAGVAEDVPRAALRVVVVENRQHALAFGGVRNDAAVDALDDRLRVFVDHQALVDRVVFADDFELFLVPALDDLPDLLEETQVGPLRFVAVDAPQVVAGQLVNDGLVAQFVELEAHRLAVFRDGGAERGFDRQEGGVEAIIGRAGEVGGKVVAVGLQAVADQVGEADFEAVALTQRAQRGVFGRLGVAALAGLEQLEGDADDVRVLGRELAGLRVDKVVAAAQRPAGKLGAASPTEVSCTSRRCVRCPLRGSSALQFS